MGGEGLGAGHPVAADCSLASAAGGFSGSYASLVSVVAAPPPLPVGRSSSGARLGFEEGRGTDAFGASSQPVDRLAAAGAADADASAPGALWAASGALEPAPPSIHVVWLEPGPARAVPEDSSHC